MTASAPPKLARVHPPRRLMRLVNPVVRRLAGSAWGFRLVGPDVMILHLTGRRTGRALDVPVSGRKAPDGRLLVLTDSLWRLNLRGRPDVRVTWRGLTRISCGVRICA